MWKLKNQHRSHFQTYRSGPHKLNTKLLVVWIVQIYPFSFSSSVLWNLHGEVRYHMYLVYFSPRSFWNIVNIHWISLEWMSYATESKFTHQILSESNYMSKHGRPGQKSPGHERALSKCWLNIFPIDLTFCAFYKIVYFTVRQYLPDCKIYVFEDVHNWLKK